MQQIKATGIISVTPGSTERKGSGEKNVRNNGNEKTEKDSGLTESRRKIENL